MDEPIAAGELPQEVMNSTKLILVPSYFVKGDSNFKLPRMCKQLKNEGDVAYETRIKNYLLNMDDN